MNNEFSDDEIYVPMCSVGERRLRQLERHTGLHEKQIIRIALANLLACIRQFENDNDPEDDDHLHCADDNDNSPHPPVAATTAPAGHDGRSAIGLSPPEMPTG